MSRDLWDVESTRPSARTAFAKVVACGTAALGAEVFASGTEERVVFHTCKSRACPSCGQRATVEWQRNLWRELPDVAYSHVCLTMPDVLWPFFQNNRHLLHALPVLGAQVLQQLAIERYGVRLLIAVLPHTFGRHLNFNCHLHILVSQGGLSLSGAAWRKRAGLDREDVMRAWRDAVIAYVRKANQRNQLVHGLTEMALAALLSAQERRVWMVDLKHLQNKTHVLRYAGRYARRPPIAQHRFRQIDRQCVRFSTKDTRTKRLVVTTFSTRNFLRTLADHVPDHYRHNVRYFGLLAPRTKAKCHDRVFALVGQKRLGKPRKVSWAESLRKSFGISPLIASNGQPMRWLHRLPPTH